MSQAANSIDASQWTLFDKILYGGLGYGSFCLPSDFFKVILAILFPPLGEVINIVEDTVSSVFPYFTWDTLRLLFSINALNHIVYSLILTTLFYIPGLVYTLTNIVNKERRVIYDKSSYIYENPNIKQPSGSSTTDDLQYVGNKIEGGLETAGDEIGGGLETAGDEIGGGFESVGDSIGSLF